MSLECEHLCFAYNHRPILQDISFCLRPGTVTAILGRNGSGKSTLLSCLNGLQRPTSGSLRLDGQDLLSRPQEDIARHVSLVPQEHVETFPFSVLEVVVMGRTPYLGPFSSPGPKDYAMALSALQALNAVHMADRNFNRISGGERRIALLARSMVQEAEIMLLDEPTNHLDYKNQFLLLDYVRSMARETGTAVLASMHDPTMALHFADHAMLLKDGRLMDSGQTHRVMTPEAVSSLYDIDARLLPTSNGPKVFLPSMVADCGPEADECREFPQSSGPRVVLVTGSVQSGKSTLVTRLLAELQRAHVSTAGILAEGLWKNDQRAGFDLRDLHDGTVTPLARRDEAKRNGAERDGARHNGGLTPYTFFPEGDRAGRLALSPERCANSDVIVVDEVGKLELAGKGWADCLPPLLRLNRPVHIWIVRDYLVEQVIERWNLQNHVVVQANRAGSLQRLIELCHPDANG
ncbi:MAG: ATP-binding cassette domain-containing protein [Desulfovibrio sp.]|uniref:ATP-binding cassette domain-containing protein n=1 Tax=Desulfovibrio sp. 7SRBS1 TaxID=3378064 RepID=UPI003B4159A1